MHARYDTHVQRQCGCRARRHLIAWKIRGDDARLRIAWHKYPRTRHCVVYECEQLGSRTPRRGWLIVEVWIRPGAGHAIRKRVERHHEQTDARQSRAGNGRSRVTVPEGAKVPVRVRQGCRRTGPLPGLALATVEKLPVEQRWVIDENVLWCFHTYAPSAPERRTKSMGGRVSARAVGAMPVLANASSRTAFSKPLAAIELRMVLRR